MFCPKCGTENADDKELCMSCSNDLKDYINQTAVKAQTSGLAIASFVLAILGLFFLFFTLYAAIICGKIALVQICCSKGRLKGKGFAIAGITLSVILLIIPC